MKSLIAIITYAVFIIDIGTIVYQYHSYLEMVVFTRYTEGRRIRLFLWNKRHGNSSYDKSMDNDIET